MYVGENIRFLIKDAERHSNSPNVCTSLILAAGFTAAILKKRSSTINTEPTSPRSQED
ncbi:hypothetical protein YC2023_088715 [Brassica napus]